MQVSFRHFISPLAAVVTMAIGIGSMWTVRGVSSVFAPATVVLSERPVAQPAYFPESAPTVFSTSEPANDANVDDADISSPYGIQGFINSNPTFDAGRLWERLGISDPGNSSFFQNCTDCKSDVDEPNFGDFQGTLLLRIENRGTEECRYLLFHRSEPDKFRLIGVIDHAFGRYEMPHHRWLETKGMAFLVVRVQTISGSGVAMFADRIFGIRLGRLVEIAWIPGSGHELMSCSPEPGMEFLGRIKDVSKQGDQFTVRVGLKVKYIDCNAGNIGTKKRQMVYRWSARSGKTSLDRKGTNVTSNELRILNGLMGKVD